MNILANRVKEQNIMIVYINRVVPKLCKRFEKEIKYKNNMSPIKPYMIEILKLVEPTPPKVKTLITWGEHMVSVKFNTNYQNSDHTCKYIEEIAYIYNHTDKQIYKFKPIKRISIRAIEDAQIELQRLLVIQNDLNKKITEQNDILVK